jgi:hypothetical protein
MNNTQAYTTCFLSHCFFKIAHNNINIPANAQGLILSQIAAGTSIKKNCILCIKDIVKSASHDAKTVAQNSKNSTKNNKPFFILIFI